MRQMKSILLLHWLLHQNDMFFIDFLFYWCMNHDMQEWIARYVIVSFDMVQPGSVSNKHWILLYMMICPIFKGFYPREGTSKRNLKDTVDVYMFTIFVTWGDIHLHEYFKIKVYIYIHNKMNNVYFLIIE